jgi:hypothetical protein
MTSRRARCPASWRCPSAALLLATSCGQGPTIDVGALHTGAGALPIDATHVDPNAPPFVRDLFEDAEPPAKPDPKRTPRLTYPNHETFLPRNAQNVLHEWISGEKNDLFELELRGPRGRALVYTTAVTYVPNSDIHAWLDDNAGEDIELGLRALESSRPDRVFASEPIRIRLGASAIDGTIYYWSTGVEGVMQALLSEPAAVKFYTNPGSAQPQCVGCHALSRDGQKLAVVYEGEKLEVVSMSDRSVLFGAAPAPPPPPDGEMPMPPAPEMMPEPADMALGAAWSSFSPDAQRIVTAVRGKLALLDAASGAPVGAGTIALPEGRIGTHPDWSPLGDRLAITLGTKGGDKEVEGGAIAVLAYDGAAFGPAEVVVPNEAPDDNHYFPSFSPDGRYLAFVRTKGKSRDSKRSVIQLYAFDDGRVIDLPRLNSRENNADAPTDLGNSMPVWAPSVDAGVYFLAFSSLRAYGSLRARDKKVDQLWIAAVDPTLEDPGYAAFWAPFQSLDQGNHRAIWTQASPGRQCYCTEICGDGVDNDCDDGVDESECTASCEPHETCGDGVDNDCNCVVDECTSSEVCDDLVDNDGDGLVDLEDSACEPR